MGYSVKQVSAMTGLPVSTLRYYDKMGLLPGLERRPSGYRSFTDGDLEMLRIIDSFKQAGLQIRDMQEYIRLVQQGAGTLEKRYEMFLDQERKLKARMAELEQALQVTRRKLRYYQEALIPQSATQSLIDGKENPMEFRTLVYFMEVAQKKSFTKAAASLHISQPALSKQIRLLEEELHCQLFERFPRQIRLTAQGEAFYEQAIKVNFMKEQLLDQFRNYDGELHGTIKLGVMDQSLLFAGRILAAFLRQHAKVSLELTVLPEEALHDGLARDLFSCVLLTEPCSANDCDYFALPFTHPCGIIATDTSLEGKEGIQARDLRTMNLAVPDRLLVRNLLAGWIGGNERGTRPVMYYTGVQEMYPLAQAGSVQILALEPDGLPADLVFRPLVPAVTSRCLVAWNKYRLLSVLEQQFLAAFSRYREEEMVTAREKTSENGETRPPAVQTV